MPAFLTITREHPDKHIEGSKPFLMSYIDDKPYVMPEDEKETTVVLFSLDFASLGVEQEGVTQLEGLHMLLPLHEDNVLWELLEQAFKKAFEAGCATGAPAP